MLILELILKVIQQPLEEQLLIANKEDDLDTQEMMMTLLIQILVLLICFMTVQIK
jgi:hypothetical protein